MDKKGEIDFLTKLIRPNLGLITNISYAHIKNFSNLNQIANAKSEIINNIITNGTMVINMDDKYYKLFLKISKNRGLKILTFSKVNNKADIVFLGLRKYKKNFIINIKIKGIIKSFSVSKHLSNYIDNILASLSILSAYFDIKRLKHNLFSGFYIPKSRGSLINLKKGTKKLTLIDESYNSNPLSLKFALERYDALFKKNHKKFLLIGDMLELGKHSKNYTSKLQNI